MDTIHPSQTSLEGAPFDVWERIAYYLTVKDLWRIRAVSRTLRLNVDTRSIWHAVLTDLLSVKPLPYTQRDLENMTTEQLQGASMSIAKIDVALSTPELVPRVISRVPMPPTMRHAVLLPGGQRYMTADNDLTIQLYDVNSSTPVATLPVDDASRPNVIKWLVLPLSLNEVIILRSVLHIGGVTRIALRDIDVIQYKGGTLSLVDQMHFGDAQISEVAFMTLVLYDSEPYLAHSMFNFGQSSVVVHTCKVGATMRGKARSDRPQIVLELSGCINESSASVIVFLSPRRLLHASLTQISLFDVPADILHSREPVKMNPFWTLGIRGLSDTRAYGTLGRPMFLDFLPSPRLQILIWGVRDQLHILDLSPDADVYDDVRISTTAFIDPYRDTTAEAITSAHFLLAANWQTFHVLMASAIFENASRAGERRLGRSENILLGTLDESTCTAKPPAYISLDEISGRMLIIDGYDEGRRYLTMYDLTERVQPVTRAP